MKCGDTVCVKGENKRAVLVAILEGMDQDGEMRPDCVGVIEWRVGNTLWQERIHMSMLSVASGPEPPDRPVSFEIGPAAHEGRDV